MNLYSLSTLLKTLCLPRRDTLNLFPNLSFTWKNVYIFPRIVRIDTRLRVFHYKVLNNALYLNKHLYIFQLSNTKCRSFCNQEDITIIHLFGNCPKSKTLWNILKEFFKNIINLSLLTPQSVIFGFLQANQELFLILNYFTAI